MAARVSQSIQPAAWRSGKAGGETLRIDSVDREPRKTLGAESEIRGCEGQVFLGMDDWLKLS